MSDKKVIDFPVERVKKKEENQKALSKAAKAQHFQKLVPLTVLSIFVMYGFLNSFVFSDYNKKVQIRGIASIGPQAAFTRNVKWEHKLAEDLSRKPFKRGIASVGRTPDSTETLVTSLIHSKYQVNFKEGKLVRFEFPEQVLGQDDPDYINRYEFLNKHRSIMPVSYKQYKQTSKKEVGNRIHETFDLLGEGSTTLAQVEFKMDKYGRLLSMKVLDSPAN